MRGSYPLNLARLHAACFELLSHPECSLSYKRLATADARVLWDDVQPPTNIAILVDANADPLNHVSSVLHELAHVVLHSCFVGRMTADLEEVAIVAYEAALYAYVRKSPKRLGAWTTLISTKLPQATDADS